MLTGCGFYNTESPEPREIIKRPGISTTCWNSWDFCRVEWGNSRVVDYSTLADEQSELSTEDRTLNYMPGEVLVEFKKRVTEERIGLLSEKLSISIIEKVKGTEIYRFRLPPGIAVDEAVEKLKQMSEVKQAQPNYIYRNR